MLKDNLFFKGLIFIGVTCSLFGCASLPSIPTNSTIAVVRPYEKVVDGKPVMGIYSTASLKTPGGRVLCVNDIQPPTIEDMKKRFEWIGMDYLSKYAQLRQERQRDILLKNGASIALWVGPKTETQTSFTGFSTEFLGNLMLVAMSAVTKTNAYNTTSGAFVSGATGAYQYTGSGEEAIKSKTEIIQKNGYMVSAMRIDEKSHKLLWETVHCPEAVENDKWACLSVVAMALEAATNGR
jgi:hypothetical protein